MRRQKRKHMVCLEEPKSPIAEAYRTLRSNIQFAGFNKDQRVLLVTSADPGEGKTTTIVNLGIVMSQANQKVLLIDADMRKPSLHKRFLLINEEIGLSNLLIKQVEIGEVIQRDEESGLDVIPAGSIPPNPAELLHSQQMSKILEHVKQEYDYVLLDSPPLLPVTDAQVISRYVDGVLLVISSGSVQRAHVKKAVSLLEMAGANVIGSILNNKKMAVNHYYI